MGLDGPSVPVRVEPVKFPQPEPVHEPATPAQPSPEKTPEEVPA